jgi:hypothetical protein
MMLSVTERGRWIRITEVTVKMTLPVVSESSGLGNLKFFNLFCYV